MVRSRHSNHGQFNITEGFLDPLENAGDTATQNTNHHRGHPNSAHTIFKHHPVPDKSIRGRRNHNKSKKSQQIQNEYEFPYEIIVNAISPVFLPLPFDAGRTPGGGAPRRFHPKMHVGFPSKWQVRLRQAGWSASRLAPFCTGPQSNGECHKHGVYCIYYDFGRVFIYNMHLIRFIMFLLCIWMIFNDFNQILTTLNQCRIQLNQVSALLINLDPIRDLF